MLYHYRIQQVLHIVDGDTFDVMIDLGFRCFHSIRVRVLDVNCPDRNDDPDGYQIAKDFTAEWLKNAGRATLQSWKKDKYGRWLAHVWTEDEEPLADKLLELGYAVPYMTNKNPVPKELP